MAPGGAGGAPGASPADREAKGPKEPKAARFIATAVKKLADGRPSIRNGKLGGDGKLDRVLYPDIAQRAGPNPFMRRHDSKGNDYGGEVGLSEDGSAANIYNWRTTIVNCDWETDYGLQKPSCTECGSRDNVKRSGCCPPDEAKRAISAFTQMSLTGVIYRCQPCPHAAKPGKFLDAPTGSLLLHLQCPHLTLTFRISNRWLNHLPLLCTRRHPPAARLRAELHPLRGLRRHQPRVQGHC